MAALIRRGMRGEGLAADVAATGEDALWMARATDYDVIVLDVMLPGIDGLEVCRRLRADGIWTPILMLTARDAVARPRRRPRRRRRRLPDQAVLVRGAAGAAAGAGATGARSSARSSSRRGGTAARPRRRGGSGAARQEIALSAKEFALLEAFMRRPGQVLSRFALLEQAWDYDYENRSNVVDVLRPPACGARSTSPFGTDSIETVRGVRLPAARRGPRMSRLPIRVRVTLAFTAVMAVVLAAVGLFALPAARIAARRVARHRAALARRRPRRARRRHRRAPRRAPGAIRWSRATRASPRSSAPTAGCSTRPRRSRGRRRSVAAELEAASAGAAAASITTARPGSRREVRLLATPIDFGGRAAVAGRRRLPGRSRRGALEPRDRCSRSAARWRCCSPRSPATGPPGAALRPVEAMRRRAAEISADSPGERLPGRPRRATSSPASARP